MARPSLARPAAVAVGLALLLGGCSAATADQGAPVASESRSAGADFPEGPGPQDRPDPALAGEPVPTLPPGDPGTGTEADAGDDRADGEAEQRHGGDDGHRRVTAVPDSALVDPETVAALAGGTWTVDPDGGEPCATTAPASATASRTVTLTSGPGRLVQTVSAHGSAGAARDAVAELTEQLAGCGFAPDGDPRLGEASAQLTREVAAGRELATVLAVEGASVVLVGSGAAAEQAAWPALADVALGTACAAGEHGCH